MNAASQCPLPLVRTGTTVRLHRITGDPKTQHHLVSLGLIPGAELQLIGRSNSGPFIVGLKSGRLMLGHATARHIWVE